MKDAVKEYKKRRAQRVQDRKGEKRYDSVEEFRIRRARRTAARNDAKFEESDHPRGKDGKFAPSSGGKSSKGKSGDSTSGSGKSKLSALTVKTFKEDRNKYLEKFKSGGEFITEDTELKQGDVVSDGKQTFVVSNVGTYRTGVKPLTKSDKTFDGENVSGVGSVSFSRKHFEKYKVVGRHESLTEDEMEERAGKSEKSSAGSMPEPVKSELTEKEKGQYKKAGFISDVSELSPGDIVSDGKNKYIVGTKGGYRTGLKTGKNGSEVMHSPKSLEGKYKVIGHMDEADAVESYRERRARRLDSRMDAGIGWAYGLAKSEGIDTTGMTPQEVFEALEKKGIKAKPGGGKETGGKKGAAKETREKKAAASSAAKAADPVKGSSYVSSYKTSGGVEYPKPKKGAVYDEDTLREVNRLADDHEGNIPPKTRAQEAVLRRLTSKDLTYQRDPDGTVVASIPGLSQMYDRKVKGKSPEVQAAYDKRIEAGKQITQDMIAISDQLGSRMMGLENCFKGGGSTARKIDKVKDKWRKNGVELTDEQALEKMDDVVRFSYKCDHGKMTEQIKGLEKALAEHGYEITERDNKFLPKEDGTERDYKAVHLQVRAPSGELFEVQIQSEETIKVKNKNHHHYEKARKLPDGDPEKARLTRVMIDNWAGMKEPDGILALPSFKKKSTANKT